MPEEKHDGTSQGEAEHRRPAKPTDDNSSAKVIQAHVRVATQTEIVRAEELAHQPHRLYARASYLDFLRAQRRALDMIPKVTRDEFAWAVHVALRTGVSQTYAAEKFTVTQPTLGRWARGDHIPSNPIILAAYMETLKSCFDDFIDEAERSDGARALRKGPRPLSVGS